MWECVCVSDECIAIILIDKVKGVSCFPIDITYPAGRTALGSSTTARLVQVACTVCKTTKDGKEKDNATLYISKELP